MIFRRFNGFLLSLSLLSSLPCLAHTSIAGVHGGGASRLTGALVMQDASYETGTEFDIESQILAFAYKAAVNPALAVGAGIGLMIDGELEQRGGSIDDGSGFRLFLDGDYEFKRINNNQLLGTFSLIHDRLKFDEQNAELEFTITDLKIGALVLHRVQSIALYGGLDIFIFSDGEVEVPNQSRDVERDDRINARLGASYAIDASFDVRADLYLLGEQTLTLAADISI